MPAKEIKVKNEDMKDVDKVGNTDYFLNPTGHIRDRIIINESEKLPQDGIFISLNGYSFLAKPGVEIDLPRPVRLMLDTRIHTETIQVEGQKPITRDIKRITYQIVKLDVKPGEKGKVAKPPEGEEWMDNV